MSGLGHYWILLLKGTEVTLELTALSLVVSLVLGTLIAVLQGRASRPVRAVIRAYIELVRGLPAILQLMLLFFGLTQFGIFLSPMVASAIWLCFYGTAYASVIVRTGINGVPKGQLEAATALGLRRYQTLRRVVLPLALMAMIPPLTNFSVLQLKNTTLIYFIGGTDILYQAQLGASATDRPGPIYLMAAVIYIVLNGSIGRIGSYLERVTTRALR
jgi:polar amino acid transport system permease protein